MDDVNLTSDEAKAQLAWGPVRTHGKDCFDTFGNHPIDR